MLFFTCPKIAAFDSRLANRPQNPRKRPQNPLS